MTPLYDDKIIERKLYYERFHVFTSHEHPLFQTKLVSDSDLDPSSIWLLEEGHCLRDQVIRICNLNRRKNVLDNVNFESGSMETLINLVRRGSGYTLVPELATSGLSSEETEQNLKQFKKPIPTREISLVFPPRSFKQSIIDGMEKTIKLNLPDSIRNLKNENIDIIDI